MNGVGRTDTVLYRFFLCWGLGQITRVELFSIGLFLHFFNK